MLCTRCDEPARGVCQFCGKALCKPHTRTARWISGWKSMGQGGWGQLPKTRQDTIEVRDANWCALCRIDTVRHP